MTDFYCQRCSNPINISDSLLNLNTHQVNLLKNTTPSSFNDPKPTDDDDLDPTQFISKERLDLYNSLDHEAKPMISRMDIDPNHHDNIVSVTTSLTSNSFVMLSDGTESVNEKNDLTSVENGVKDVRLHDSRHSGAISDRLKILSKVFDILSKNNEIDHPLCQECSNLIIENYKLKFDQSQKEKDYYLNFLKKLRDQGEQVTEEEAEIDPKLIRAIKEYDNLTIMETEKLQELKQLEETKQKLDDQLKSLKREYDELETNELNEILALRNDLSLDLAASVNTLNQTKAQYQLHLNHLDKLRSTNIYTQFFSISTDSANKYGTINGFRLGYKVPWSEINSALGQIVLLLVFLMKRLDLKLDNYKLVPSGSQSHIIKISNEPPTDGPSTEPVKTKTVLNLFSSNEFSLGKLFNFNKFDVSMIALLDILYQIQKKVKTLDNELDLPYHISSKKDTIGGKSVRVTSNGEWTDSCKFLLTNLNWLLTYTSVHTISSAK